MDDELFCHYRNLDKPFAFSGVAAITGEGMIAIASMLWFGENIGRGREAMNLFRLLTEHADSKPIRVGLIGAGKFGTMFLSQARRTPGLHIMGIADLSPDRAVQNLSRAGWPASLLSARNPSEAIDSGMTWVGDDNDLLIGHPALEIVIDATGNPIAGITHALKAIANGKHIIMVNVEADALAGPLLAQRARAAGVVYSLAYGDQPALIAELWIGLVPAGLK